MSMDVALFDPMDTWHGMLVIYCRVGFGRVYKLRHEHKYLPSVLFWPRCDYADGGGKINTNQPKK